MSRYWPFLAAVITVLLLAPQPAGAAEPASLDEQLQPLIESRDLPAIREKLADVDPDSADSAELRWLAWLARVDGEPERARELLEQAVEADPADAEAHFQLATSRLDELQDAGAIRSMRIARALRAGFQDALEADPDHISAHIGLIQYYLNAPRVAGGGMDRATPHLEKLREIDRAAYLHMQASVALARDDDLDEALERMGEAIAEDPESVSRQLQYGMLLQMAEQWDRAWAAFEAITELQPHHAGAWYQKGRTAVLGETRLEEGMAAFEQYFALPAWPENPPAAAAHWRLGMLHELSGDPDAARQAYEAALDEDENFDEARKALEALDA